VTNRPSLVSTITIPDGQAVTFDIKAFDQALASQGVGLVHFRAMRCPMGLVDLYDNRRPEHDHSGCSNGFIHQKIGRLTATFTGVGKHSQQMDVGSIDGSTAQVTVQRFYDNTQIPVYVAPYDRMYLDEESIIVPTWQLFEAHIDGRDKMVFPVVEVQSLMSSDGRVFTEGDDFEVRDGYVVWSGSNRPQYDAYRKRGQICSIRYLYRPFWVVKQLLHEVRVTQAEDAITGERRIHRMPQAMVLQREYVFLNESTGDPNNPREVPAPREGSFGAR